MLRKYMDELHCLLIFNTWTCRHNQLRYLLSVSKLSEVKQQQLERLDKHKYKQAHLFKSEQIKGLEAVACVQLQG